MRLIDVKTLQLREFHHKIPTYAILSHTWGREEVTLQEYLHATEPGPNSNPNAIRRKAGFAKILGACSRARADGLEYLWCDTNCIDKTSSAELSEAINSMYAWYRDSAVCYAYLADIGSVERPGMVTEELKTSRWFTRGWTLQELLAPTQVLFFNANWVFITGRQQLAEIICRVAKIHVGALKDRDTIPEYSIAQRMSWAAHRQTSRQEDIAYCLLGIFDINMPLLYGEGIKAFTRLQEEMIKVSDDQSILAWDFVDDQNLSLTGILASSPSNFASCGSIVRDMTVEPCSYSVTNLGIFLQVPRIRTSVDATILVRLNCSTELLKHGSHKNAQAENTPRWHFPIWIWLRSIGHSIYTRSPTPVSRTSLTSFYTDGLEDDPIELYGITSTCRAESWVSNIFSSIRSHSVISTPFHITISFGRIRPQTRTFEKSYPPGDYAVHQIPPRGSYASSHEVVSAGNYVVFFSVVCDGYQQPKYWRHTIISDVNKTAIGIMSANDWDILFHQEPSPEAMNDMRRLDYVHDRIQKLLSQPKTATNRDILPYVYMEKNIWHDHHKQAKVVIHLTFQEAT